MAIAFISRRKEERKTDLATVDLVIYALFSYVVRVSAAAKQIFTVQPDSGRARLLLLAHSLECPQVLGWCRGDPFYAHHVAVTEISRLTPGLTVVSEDSENCCFVPRARTVRFTDVEVRVSDLGYNSFLGFLSDHVCALCVSANALRLEE